MWRESHSSEPKQGRVQCNNVLEVLIVLWMVGLLQAIPITHPNPLQIGDQTAWLHESSLLLSSCHSEVSLKSTESMVQSTKSGRDMERQHSWRPGLDRPMSHCRGQLIGILAPNSAFSWRAVSTRRRHFTHSFGKGVLRMYLCTCIIGCHNATGFPFIFGR